MIVVPFLPVHLASLELQKDQEDFAEIIKDPAYGEMLMESGPAYTGLENGVCMICAGIWNQGHKGQLWALISGRCRNMVAVVRGARRLFLSGQKFERLEFVTKDIQAQHRLARLLGFTLETPEGMPKHWPDGETGFLYARVE